MVSKNLALFLFRIWFLSIPLGCQQKASQSTHSQAASYPVSSNLTYPSQTQPPQPPDSSQTNPIKNHSKSKASITFAFYNVENLFDTFDDPHTDDKDFTPYSQLQWDSVKYQTKLKHISKVLNDLSADFIGLEEVENRKVLEDLLPFLSRSYAIIHEDSPDRRGIDVCALYDPKVWKVIKVTWLDPNPHLSDYLERPTRFILEILAVPHYSLSDTFVFYVNHWPSRRNDEISRIRIAQFLKQRLLLYLDNSHYFVIIGGDLNDEPFNKSVRDALGASSNPSAQTPLIDLAYQYSFYGTHQYRKRWHILDHIIVSKNLFQHYSVKADIFHPDYLLEHSGSYAGFPWRTAVGSHYLGGYSDHLPVKAQLIPLE